MAKSAIVSGAQPCRAFSCGCRADLLMVMVSLVAAAVSAHGRRAYPAEQDVTQIT
jgi:hypothetical protein